MSHTRFNQAVQLRLANHLDDAADTGFRLWSEGYRTPWLALLNGNIALDCGEYEFACRWHEIAFLMCTENGQVKPEAAGYFQDIALPFAYDRMRLGVWDELTFDLWEAGRLHRSWHPAPGTQPWKGSADKLLILSEGGYGDVFLMTRLFQRLDPIQRAASRFVVGPQMRHLKGFAGTWDGIPAYYHDEIVDWSGFKYSTPLMSLLSFTGIRTPADIPAAEPLKVDPVKSPARFGIAWQAEELGTQKRIRSIDREEELEPLSKFTFVSLLPGKTLPFAREADIGSWMKTARLMAGLDAVVACDTAAAHLAGLLNIPTLLIVPLASDWKWSTTGDSSYWWPSLRLIRNDSPYSWKTAIEKTAEILEKL